jgi:serine/threonine-protein kinase
MLGEAFGPYRILGKLGEGGMGEVYRARDAALNRDVAIKVLPAAVAAEPERLARFKREAQVLASLNHPNIAHVHGFEAAVRSDGATTHFLAMEMVEGEDLSERLKRGAIPVDEAIAIARQIAEGLEEAHEHGIVHRDLKPANVKVTPDGKVKILDFGLAKALEGDASSSGANSQLSYSPTMSRHMTEAGIIMGTAAYMSPEQARGRTVDKRADIWSFGVVLYEMLTGGRLFSGETVSDVLAAVLTRELNLDRLPPATPGALRRLIQRCLERDPRRRLRDIGEARLALEDPGSGADPAAAPRVRTRAERWVLATGLALAILLGFLIARLWSPPTASNQLRLVAKAGLPGVVDDSLRALAALSPDGRTLALSARERVGGQRLLYVRRLDQAEATPLAGTEDAANPFFSPDGQWIGFFAKGKLAKIPVTGGAAVVLADAPTGRGGTWGEDDVITFTPLASGGNGLYRVPAAGGAVTPLGDMVQGHVTQRWPQALPGNRTILYTGSTTVDTFEDACLVAQTLDTAPPRLIQCGGSFWTYAPSGHILFFHAGTLFAAPFDVKSLTITGSSLPVIKDVGGSAVSGVAWFSLARNGLLAYVEGEAAGADAPIDVVDRAGEVTRLKMPPVNWAALSYSPDGRRLAMSVYTETKNDVWIYDIERDAPMQLTFDGLHWSGPVWTPDGRRLTYSTSRGGSPFIEWKAADGSGEAERLSPPGSDQKEGGSRAERPGSWAPDGRRFAFVEGGGSGHSDIWMLPMVGDVRSGLKPGKPEIFIASPNHNDSPAFSPDGKWLAYSSDDSSTAQIYVRSATGAPGKWQVSIEGGTFPAWSRTGRELLFVTPDGRLLYVTYEASDGAFHPSRPEPWTSVLFEQRTDWFRFALHPDGRRVAGAVTAASGNEKPKDPEIVLVTNFFDELEARFSQR